MLTALKGFSTACPLCYFWFIFGYFLFFLRTICFLMRFCTYILDNTLMMPRIKNYMGLLPFAGGYFFFLVVGGGEGEEHFCYLPLFLQSSSIFFAKFSIDSFAINLTITQIIWLVLWPCKTIWGYAWAHLGTCSFLSKGNQNFLIMFCTEHLGITLMALSTSSPSAWNLVG